jgi:hypothetical protein
MKTRLEKMGEWLSGAADEETREELRQDLADPAGPATALLRNLVLPKGSRARWPARKTAGPGSPWKLWVLGGSLLAAALLVGLVVGRWVLPGGGPPPPAGPSAFLLASITPQPGPGRGGHPAERVTLGTDGAYRLEARRDFRVVVQSPRPGFATLVLLAPGRVDVFPRPVQEEIQVEAFPQSQKVGPLPGPGTTTTVLAVVTERPAAETIRQVLPAGGAAPAEVDRLLGDIRQGLRKAGQPWAAVGRITVEPAPPK